MNVHDQPPVVQRYFALDVLRGMTIALMILVNTPGSWASIYAPFEHSAWHGFTLTDLVFPTFLFVIGNAASFSLKKYKNRSNSAFLSKVFKRTGLIFLIGFLLNAFPFIYRAHDGLHFIDFTEVRIMRIMGVLQRIALCYGIASLLLHYLSLKKAMSVSVLILLGYWALLWFFGDHPAPYSLENNAALKLDFFLFPSENLYQGYGIAFDPEGILSTLPAVVNVIAGYAAGIFIQKWGNTRKTIINLAISGVFLLITALLWDIFFPINKPIWTSSYVLFSTGWDLVILAALIYILEIAKQKSWTYFFEAFGRNPLFIYIMSGVVITLMGLLQIGGQSLSGLVYENLFLSWLTPYNASLAFAVSYVLLMWLLGYILDKNKIYIKV
ncbi:acyltransferase family protein [Flavimarina sp. Hel_I_48]|uniref:acyltransferase family protein n=1 Tax=Flavimarina sp. Hel_I_48 TaxID=1392488 RepID=UPI0004DEFEC0|nr:DUF5009 domain-containing protein [Flavimarina sp. Hel_I_48]